MSDTSGPETITIPLDEYLANCRQMLGSLQAAVVELVGPDDIPAEEAVASVVSAMAQGMIGGLHAASDAIRKLEAMRPGLKISPLDLLPIYDRMSGVIAALDPDPQP